MVIYVSLGCVCFGSQEKVNRACPEFIQASELRFSRQPPPQALSAAVSDCSGRKKDEFTLQPVLCAPPCVVSLDGFQCKCQEKHKERSVAIKVLIFFLFKWLYKREE